MKGSRCVVGEWTLVSVSASLGRHLSFARDGIGALGWSCLIQPPGRSLDDDDDDISLGVHLESLTAITYDSRFRVTHSQAVK